MIIIYNIHSLHRQKQFAQFAFAQFAHMPLPIQ